MSTTRSRSHNGKYDLEKAAELAVWQTAAAAKSSWKQEEEKVKAEDLSLVHEECQRGRNRTDRFPLDRNSGCKADGRRTE